MLPTASVWPEGGRRCLATCARVSFVAAAVLAGDFMRERGREARAFKEKGESSQEDLGAYSEDAREAETWALAPGARRASVSTAWRKPQQRSAASCGGGARQSRVRVLARG